MSPLSVLYVVLPIVLIVFLRRVEDFIWLCMNYRCVRNNVALHAPGDGASHALSHRRAVWMPLLVMAVELMLALVITAVLLCVPSGSVRIALWLWMTIPLVAISRAVLQIIRLLHSRKYIPGVVVGVLSLPVAGYAVWSLALQYSWWQMLLAWMVGCVGCIVVHVSLIKCTGCQIMVSKD